MTRKIMVGYGATILAVVAFYFTFPGMGLVFAGIVGLTTLVAIGSGIVLHRPRFRLPWLLIAAAVAAQSTGDIIYTYLNDVAGEANPFPCVGDAFYLVVYPLLGVGLIRLLRSGAAARDTASLLDALTVTCGLGLLTWIFLINPLIDTPGVPPLARVISISFPLFDVLLVTVLIRMATSLHRSPSVMLIITGLGVLLGADIGYSALQLAGNGTVGSVVDALYVLNYPALGLAALHPSMAGLTEPRLPAPTQAGRQRVAVLGLASLIPPAVLITESLTGGVRDGLVIGVLSAVLFALVVARLAGVVAGHRQSIARELGLRRAGAALLAASTVEEVVAAVGAAVADLLPPYTTHSVEVATGTPILDRDPRVLRTGDGYVLRCPLAGRRVTGRIDISADETALVALHEAVQVLAGQAVLALDGLAAGAEIVRRESETYFRTLVLNAADVIVILDDHDRVRYASPSAAAMFGGVDPVGTALPDLVDASARVLLDAVRAGTEAPELTDWTLPGKQVEVACRDLRHEPSVAGIVVTLRDVTEHRRLERELLHRAYYDDLTGLPNRALFTQRLEKTDRPAGVLLVGLDDFKVINDAMGHDTGDELLVVVARRLVAALAPRYALARIGGDEFAVLVEADSDDSAVEIPAELVLAAFAEPFRLPGGGVVTCHASVGMVKSSEADDGLQLLGRADIALAMAKSGGKGRACRYETTLHTRILERLQLHAALDQAITDGEFRLVYQPIVALGSGQTRGFEALVRWHHPSRGMVPPLDFIGIAEESGLIVPLGEWVLRTAVAAAASWPGLTYVAVNVSPRQFRVPGFVDLVRRALDDHGLPADRLVLEITESLLLDDRDQDRIRSELDALRRVGVRVAIDDFGTGYSSLSYLHRVPVDLIKLDKSFVDTITTSPPQYELVKGIIGLAHALRLAVVAEGIEVAGDRDLLVEAGCEYGQGYLFARPMSGEDALAWVTKGALTRVP